MGKLRTNISRFLKKKPVSKRDAKRARVNVPKTGRSSKDDTMADNFQNYGKFFSIIDPWLPFPLLKIISKMTVTEPEFSKAVMNFQAVANTGHKVVVEAPENKIPTAIKRINFLAERLNIDRQINDIIDQISRNGAGSIEACVNTSLTGVRKIVLVPPYSIRFLKMDGEWHPHQFLEHNIFNQSNHDFLIPLNPITYRYDPLQVMDNSPYGIPPFLPAISPDMMQNDIFSEIKRIISNMTLFGFNLAKIPPPPEQEENETPEQFRVRYQDFIKEIVTSLSENSRDGFMGVPSDIDLDNFSVAQDIRGVKEVMERVDRKIYNGLKSDPGLHGDHTARTETFLTVIYKVLVHYSENIRRIVKRMLEYIYYLDLLLGGIFISDESVSIRFNENSSLKPNIEALAERYKILNLKDKLSIGLISPDRAAQELGYSSFYDEDLFKKSLEKNTNTQMSVKMLSWNRAAGEYELIRPSIDLSRYKTKESKEAEEKKRAELSQKKIKEYIELYLKETLPYFDDLKGDAIDYSISFFKEHVEEISEDSEVFRKAVINYISQHEEYKKIKENDSWLRKKANTYTMKAGKELFENDFSAFKGEKPDIKFVFGEGDRLAMETYAKVDHHYFSKFVSNKYFGGQIKEFTDLFLKRGESLYGQWSNAVEKEFLRLFGNAIDGDIRFQMERIINTSMASIKNRTHIRQLDEFRFKYGYINGRLDTKCRICKPLHGKRIIISKAMKTVRAFETASSIEEALNAIKKSSITLKDLETDDVEDLVLNGKKIPTFHPHCWCFIEGEGEE